MCAVVLSRLSRPGLGGEISDSCARVQEEFKKLLSIMSRGLGEGKGTVENGLSILVVWSLPQRIRPCLVFVSIIFQWRDIPQNVWPRRGEESRSQLLIPLIFVYVIWNHLSPRFRINFSEIPSEQQNSGGAQLTGPTCVELSSSGFVQYHTFLCSEICSVQSQRYLSFIRS